MFNNEYDKNTDWAGIFQDLMEGKGINLDNKKIVNCPNCKKKIKVTVNKKNKCPHCKFIFEVKTR